jgi:hypothetical protein
MLLEELKIADFWKMIIHLHVKAEKVYERWLMIDRNVFIKRLKAKCNGIIEKKVEYSQVEFLLTTLHMGLSESTFTDLGANEKMHDAVNDFLYSMNHQHDDQRI